MSTKYGLSAFEYNIASTIGDMYRELKSSISSGWNAIQYPFAALADSITNSVTGKSHNDILSGDGDDENKVRVSFDVVDLDSGKVLASHTLDNTYKQIFFDEESDYVYETSLRDALVVSDSLLSFDVKFRTLEDECNYLKEKFGTCENYSPFNEFVDHVYIAATAKTENLKIGVSINLEDDNSHIISKTIRGSDFVRSVETARVEYKDHRSTRALTKVSMWLTGGAIALFALNLLTHGGINAAHAEVMAPMSQKIAEFKQLANQDNTYSIVDTALSSCNIIPTLELSTKTPSVALCMASSAATLKWIVNIFKAQPNHIKSEKVRKIENSYGDFASFGISKMSQAPPPKLKLG